MGSLDMSYVSGKSLEKVVAAYEQGGSGYFTGSQVDALQSMLRLADRETASMVAEAITQVLLECEIYTCARARVPVDSFAKDRLGNIAKHANELSKLLRREQNNYALFIEYGNLVTKYSEIRKVSQRPKEMLECLRIVAAQATRQVEDDSEFVRARGLLPGVTSQSTPTQVARRVLWPELFELWKDVGRHVADSEDGPMHKFVALVHEVGDLPPPKRRTLRRAKEAWVNSNLDLGHSSECGQV